MLTNAKPVNTHIRNVCLLTLNSRICIPNCFHPLAGTTCEVEYYNERKSA
jgi:hypothetical protein